jgi:hypothetical protein
MSVFKDCVRTTNTAYMILIMLLIMSMSAFGGTITGSISVSPKTIQTNGTYTFTFVNSRNLTANEYFIITFPSADFVFSSETSEITSKT